MTSRRKLVLCLMPDDIAMTKKLLGALAGILLAGVIAWVSVGYFLG